MPSRASRSSASGTSLLRHRYAARRERSPVHVGQAGHKRDSCVFRDARVLLPDFPCSQGIGWLEADSQPQGFQQICSAPILSDGDTTNSYGLPRGRTPQQRQRQNTSEHLRDLSLSETWAISIDLRDAYFHVAVAPEHTRYLRFAYNGRAFEFLVLPFGLSTAPRVFTRIVRVIEAFLKVQGVDMHQYLDDWLMKSQWKSLVERHRDLTLFWVNKLGFLVNEGKSQLTPTQAPAFLGSTLDLLNVLVFPSERRILRATRLAASLLARTVQSAKTWQRFVGHLSSLHKLVSMAVVHTRPIQLMLHDQWTQVSYSPYVRI